MSMTLEEIRSVVEECDQSHLLRFVDDLDEAGVARLCARIEALDLPRVAPILRDYLIRSDEHAARESIEPMPSFPLGAIDEESTYRAHGEGLLRAGKIAAFTVAGGQGTRLGFDGPKGCYPGGAVTGKPLFRCLSEWILAAQRRYACTIPWYIMTSPLNHDATRAFFQEHDWLGLGEQNVMLFNQGVMPSVDKSTGKILLAAPDEPATNPDGHGGSLRALWASGAIADMRERGIEHICYAQIDNPLVRFIDPLFIGLHASASDSSGEFSSKMIAKTDPHEKVGLFAMLDGRAGMIEYSDLPEELATRRDEHGTLLFHAGNPAIHMLGVEFVAQLNDRPEGCALPFHRAIKTVAHTDLATGGRVDPAEPNAMKLEMFIFDALPLCERTIVMEVDRVEEFAPIKNASGGDSARTSHELQTLRAARWLESVGVTIPYTPDNTPDCTLEISPLTAMCPDDLRGVDLPDAIRPSESRSF
ncbi:MAG: UTP--glucose-1-phosphate uridylyltransferase [Planctomycetota bacterium]|jgi:UDP-N-acetylglucosamine/UDP-N-acetylgalactosamine diphosphorylase